MAAQGPTLSSFQLSFLRKPDLVGSREIYRETSGPGMKTPGFLRGCRPCLADSFLKSLAHSTYQPDPGSQSRREPRIWSLHSLAHWGHTLSEAQGS